MKNHWLEIDKEGLRKTLGQKDKVFLLTEMVSNAWDEDITEVEVSLTRPDENGVSWLRVTDNSPTGWADLSHSHTMFAESVKKGKSEKRGRFNAGEKDVLALAIEAKLTTVSGQVLFNEDGTRTEGTETRKVGSEFVAKFQLTVQEYEHICQQAKMLLPPKGITTLFNGSPIQYRKPCGSFTETLPIPLADKEGVVRNTERKATVYLYEKNPDEVATIFEMGIPIVELGDDQWHVNVMQKVPLSRDRDNVNPSYLRKVRTGVLNVQFEQLKTADDIGATWVKEAMAGKKVSGEAITHVIKETYGENPITRSVSDIGSAKEGVSKGGQIIEGGAFSKEVWANIKSVVKDDGKPLVQSSHDFAPTNVSGSLPDSLVIQPKFYTPEMKAYSSLVDKLSKRLIGKLVTVSYIDNKEARIEGCYINKFKGDKMKKGYKREFNVMVVNLAYVNPEDAQQMYTLMLHELAHDIVQSNDHLHSDFYMTVEELGGTLAELMLDEPELFDIGANSLGFTNVQPVWGVTPNVLSEGSLVVLRNKAVADK
jgi:hypothetical protein